jgi:hypothetical protein
VRKPRQLQPDSQLQAPLPVKALLPMKKKMLNVWKRAALSNEDD